VMCTDLLTSQATKHRTVRDAVPSWLHEGCCWWVECFYLSFSKSDPLAHNRYTVHCNVQGVWLCVISITTVTRLCTVSSVSPLSRDCTMTSLSPLSQDCALCLRPGSHVSHFLGLARCGNARHRTRLIHMCAGIRISLSSHIQRDGAAAEQEGFAVTT
jgi:hypothetical protein